MPRHSARVKRNPRLSNPLAILATGKSVAGTSTSMPRVIQLAASNPSAPPASANTSASVKSCRNNRHRVAPRLKRMPNSF